MQSSKNVCLVMDSVKSLFMSSGFIEEQAEKKNAPVGGAFSESSYRRRYNNVKQKQS